AVNYGVVGIPKDEAGARKVFEFAKKLGLRGVTTESADAINTIEKLAIEYDLSVGFHDHPGSFADPNYKVWNPYYIAGWSGPVTRASGRAPTRGTGCAPGTKRVRRYVLPRGE